MFKSGFTFDERADYSLQVAQQSGIHVLCLVTHDLSAEPIHYRRQPSIYYSYDRYLIGDVHSIGKLLTGHFFLGFPLVGKEKWMDEQHDRQ
ncbi:MAG: hypothetical protein WCB79_05620 [Halobacteriota archaeon]